MRVGAREALVAVGALGTAAGITASIFKGRQYLREHPEALERARELTGRTLAAGRRARKALAPVVAHVAHEVGDELRTVLPEAAGIVGRHATRAATRRGAHALGQYIEDNL